MRIRSLTLHNFRRHRDTSLEFPDGLIAILGDNGSGKSTLIEAIGFALFGVGALRTNKDLVRWDGAPPGDAVVVHLEMEWAGQAWSLERGLKGKALAPFASLIVDGVTVATSSGAVTTEVEHRLRLDQQTFFTTVIARQKELAGLGSYGAAERKRIILGMMGVDALDAAIQSVRAAGRDEGVRLETLRGQRVDTDVLRGQRDELKVQQRSAERRAEEASAAWKAAKQALAAAQTAHDEAAKSHEARRLLEQQHKDLARDLEEARKTHARIAEDIAAARKAAEDVARWSPMVEQIQSLQAQLESVRQHMELEAEAERIAESLRLLPPDAGPPPDLSQVQAAAEKADATALELREAMAGLRAHLDQSESRKRRIEDLGADAPCPTCERPLGEHLDRLRSSMAEESQTLQTRMDVHQADWKKAEKEAQAARAALDEARKQQADARLVAKERALLETRRAEIQQKQAALPPRPGADDLEGRLRAAQDARDQRNRSAAIADRLPDLQQQHDHNAKAMDQAARAANEAEARLKAMPQTAPALQRTQDDLENARVVERDAERAHLLATEAVASMRKDRSRMEDRLDEAAKADRQIAEVAERVRYWTALAGGRGRGLLESFKQHLVARIGPAVSREASRLLARFTGGAYQEIRLDEAYDLYVADQGRLYGLDRFSGGETDLVHLALRLAVSRLLAERSGGEDIRFLALDEVFGGLDEHRRASVLSALQELGNLYTQVVVVTHHEALRDALDAAIMVEDHEGQATLSIHNG